MQLKVINGLSVKIEGTWGTVMDTKSVLYASNVPHNITPETLYDEWLCTLEPLKAANARIGGYYRAGDACIRVTDLKQAGTVKWANCEQPNGDIAAPVILESLHKS